MANETVVLRFLPAYVTLCERQSRLSINLAVKPISVALSADIAYYCRYKLIWWRRRSWVHAISQSGCEIGRTQQKESQAKEAQFKWQPLLAPPSTRGNRPRQQEAPLDQPSSFHKQDVAVKVSLIDASHKYKTRNSERVICLFIFAHRTVIAALSPDRRFFLANKQDLSNFLKQNVSWVNVIAAGGVTVPLNATFRKTSL